MSGYTLEYRNGTGELIDRRWHRPTIERPQNPLDSDIIVLKDGKRWQVKSVVIEPMSATGVVTVERVP